MADDKLQGMIRDMSKGVEYFRKVRKGRSPLMERMEEAVEGPVPLPPQPELEKELKDRSTGGSLPFSEGEIKKGYRRL